MMLKDIIGFNENFRASINLYLSLNKTDKINSYIPTSSSIRVLDDYIRATLEDKEHATFLIGPYGKGKSHLMLVLLAVLTLKRTSENKDTIDALINKIDKNDEQGKKLTEDIKKAWKTKPYLPVVLNSTNSNLNQAFLVALNDALKRDGLENLSPNTYYSLAIKRIEDWKKNFKQNFIEFEKRIEAEGESVDGFVAELKRFSPKALQKFKEIYPYITAGSEFNPLAASEVLPLYKEVADQLVENYGYSGIYIVFDEFSKFIEGEDGKLVGDSMKLLQDICELAADSDKSNVYITLIAHKSIKEYGKYLSQNIINAFTGIEGRIVEKYFITSSKNNYELIKNAIVKKKDISSISTFKGYFSKDNIDKYYNLPAFRSSFNRDDFENIVVKGCFPLTPVASYLLLNISEKVAQNERTLFTFISNDEPFSMARFVKENVDLSGWNIGADLIYDYFKGMFKQDVQNELVHNIWLSAEYALGKCDNDDEKRVVKALAVILVVNKPDELPALKRYIQLSVSVDDSGSAIENLEKKEIIYKKNASNTYAFKTRAGVALRSEINRQKNIIGNNVNYSDALMKISGRHFVIPRKYNTEQMMTRYFTNEFMSVESFLDIDDGSVFVDSNCLDGKVVILYSFKALKLKEIKKHVEDLACDQLVVVAPASKLSVSKELVEYEAIDTIKKSDYLKEDNEILKREIPVIEEDIEQVVNDELNDIYGVGSKSKVFFFLDGLKTKNAGQEEDAVNDCCKYLYCRCPIINNELINRNIIASSQTRKTRADIIDALMDHTDTEDFYSGTNQIASIYRSLFIVTGIKGNKYEEENNIKDVINIINGFINDCSDNRKSFNELIEKLVTKPFGMRKGVLPVYLAYTLSERDEDLILYSDGKEIDVNADEIVKIVEHPDVYELYVSKADIEKEKYIRSLNELFHVENSHNLSESRIKNIVICMQRWFRALPQVSRNLTDIDEIDTYKKKGKTLRQIRDSLQKIEVNPYELLFDTLPSIFDTKDFEKTEKCIEKCVNIFDGYMESLVKEVTKRIRSVFMLREKQDIYHSLKEWYNRQSNLSKNGLHSSRITAFMSFIKTLNVYDDNEIARNMAKVITEVYVDNWTEGELDRFMETLTECKNETESIKDDTKEGQDKLSFVASDGTLIEKYYDKASEGTGTVLRNTIEDALDEFDDLSVNDRVSILLDMIEKVIRR